MFMKRPQWKKIKTIPMAKMERDIKCVFLISTKIEHTFYSLVIPVLGIYQDKCTHLCNKRHSRMPFEIALITASYGHYTNVHQDLKN